MKCPICSKTGLKVEINPFDGQHYIRCCAICVEGKETEQEALDEWEDFYCWRLIEDGEKKFNELFRSLEQLFDAYVKTRLEISGSMGNLSQARRREVIVHEILTELGWDPLSME